MPSSKTIIVSIIMFLSSLFSSAQIVNIESERMQSDTTGWLGNAGMQVSLSKNTKSFFGADADAHLQYKSKKDLYLLLGSYSFLKGDGTAFTDNTFLHFRYNRKIGNTLRWEAFTQLQDNIISRIQSRFLLGTGPRFKLVSRKIVHIYAGLLAMYEREKETGIAATSNVRSSNYVSFSISPNKSTELISTTYYQPLFNHFSDYRLLNQVKLKVKASKNFSLRLSWNYIFDALPATGVPRENYSFRTGVEYDF